MNVLSLCDGISGAKLALERAGVKVDNYFAAEIKNISIKCTKENNPDIISIGDVTKVHYKDGVLTWNDGASSQRVNIDLVCFGSPCFVKGTKVITKYGYKNIEDVEVGDEVLTHNNRWRKVLVTGSKIADNVVSLKYSGAPAVDVTTNHPYYVITKNKDKTFTFPEWKKVSDLKKGDYLGIPVNTNSLNEYNLTSEECYVLGRYIADGYLRTGKRPGRKNSYYHNVVLCIGKDKLTDLYKINTYHYCLKDKNMPCVKAEIISSRLVDLCKMCGEGAENKVIPQFLLDLPNDLAYSVLRGYLDGDGCHIKNKDIYSACTVSKELAYSLQQLVLKVFGIYANITYFEPPKTKVLLGRVVNQKPQYTVRWVGTAWEHKQIKYFIKDGFVWTPFRKIISEERVDEVYNLEVEEDNSYTANNIVVHNCQTFSIAIPTEHRVGLENLKKSGLFYECNRILKEVNPKYWLMENVFSMRKSDRDTVSAYLGREPVMLDGASFGPAIRRRYYWTNIPLSGCFLYDKEGYTLVEPCRKPATCVDFNKILTEGWSDREKARCLCVEDSRPNATPIKMFHRYYSTGFTSLIFKSKKHYEECVAEYTRLFGGKRCTNIAEVNYKGHVFDGVRYMNKTEMERCQGVPEGYTGMLTRNEAADVLGDGWQIDTVAFIFKGLK